MKQVQEVKFNNRALALALDAVRAAKGLEWPQVASETNVSEATLCRIRQGKNPDANTLAKLVKWCGIDFGHLIESRWNNV
jgi:transcriptional regulator with XRE-family HTH domain